MSKEAMKLALEALEELTDTEQTYEALKRGDAAITALREALADQPAQQGAVAYGMWDTMLGKDNRMMMVRLDKGQDGCTVPLYTTPQAQPAREFVGLTDGEIEQGCKESWVTEQAWQSAVWWAEEKLKEKNT